MKPLASQPSLTERVYDAILDQIATGALPAGAHLVQEQIAERLGVSRQPVQQAMALLKADGMVEEAGKRGLRVAPIDGEVMRHHYAIRAALDGLAARLAAERVAQSPSMAATLRARADEILRLGTAAVEAGDTVEQVRQDMALHTLIYDVSGNPLLRRTAEPHWRFLQRAMGEIMRLAKLRLEIWRQHAEIIDAICDGAPGQAERLMISHDLDAADALHNALMGQ